MADEKDPNNAPPTNQGKKKPDENLDLEIESPEQSSIARQIVGKVSEIVEQTDQFEDQEGEEEAKSFSGQLKRIFGALGITLKRFFGCFFMLLVVGGIIYFFSIGGLEKIRDYFSQEPKPELISKRQEEPRQHQQQPGVESALLIGNLKGLKDQWIPASIWNAYLFGREENFSEFLSRQQEIVEISFFYGFRGEPEEKYARYVNVLGNVQSALNTDIFALLNATSNRSGALQKHIQELEYLLDISSQIVTYIAAEMATARLEYDALSGLKNQSEDDFFLSVENFHGEQSVELLERFIETSQRMVDFRARNLALNKLRVLYNSALTKLSARIRDIRINAEALIKGVQVTDIVNSDLDLILPDTGVALE